MNPEQFTRRIIKSDGSYIDEFYTFDVWFELLSGTNICFTLGKDEKHKFYFRGESLSVGEISGKELVKWLVQVTRKEKLSRI
jgi:hypothetical protein